MGKRNVLIKDESLKYRIGVYAIYYYLKDIQKEIWLYVGSGIIADCYNRHDSNIKYCRYKNTNKDIIDKLHESGVELYFKVVTYCTEEEKLEIETKYIQEHKDTLCNSNNKGKCRRSKSTPEETERRRKANLGEKNPNNSKLSEEDVRAIKKLLLLDTHTTKEIAEIFECSVSSINNIRSEYRWNSVQLSDNEIEEILKEKEAISFTEDTTSNKVTNKSLQTLLA